MIGIISGMGPYTTSDFINKVVSLTPVQKDQQHVPLFIYHATQISDRREGFLNREKRKQVECDIKAALEKMQLCGVKKFAIPCNTAHIYLENIINTNLECINIIDECAKYILENHITVKVGVLATGSTIESKIYQRIFDKYNLEAVCLPPQLQKRIDQMIDDVKAGTIYDDMIKKTVNRIETYYKQKGVDIVVLGCTELPLVMKESQTVQFIDSTQVLAEAVLREHHLDVV